MNIDQIIGKLMGDGSIGEEKSALDAWKTEAEENIKALEEMQKIAALSNTLNGYQDFDANNAWESFSSKIENGGTVHQSEQHSVSVDKPSKTSIFSLGNISRIAAILVVVLGSLFVFNQYTNSSENVVEDKTYSSTVETMSFDLKDGTNVTLDKKSNLEVVGDRAVSLEGRAHFDVHRNESQQFTIDLPIGKVVVLGTEFSIDANENTTEVYVQEGSVRFELDNRTWTLVAGDLVKVENNETIQLNGIFENYDSWKNQRLVFRDNNMVEVVDALARHFKKEIIIEHKKDFSKCNVMDIYTDFTLNDILNGLSKTHGLKYEIRENKVFIVSAKC